MGEIARFLKHNIKVCIWAKRISKILNSFIEMNFFNPAVESKKQHEMRLYLKADPACYTV